MTAVLVAVAVLVWSASGPGLDRPPGRPASSRAVRLDRRRREWASGALAGVAGWLVVGGAAGAIVAAVVCCVVPAAIARLPAAADRRREAELRRRAPLACDLLAAVLSTGCPPDRALGVVAGAVGGVLGADLQGAAARWRLGDPAVSLRPLLADPNHPLHRVAAALVTSQRSGAPVAPILDAVAAELRDAARADGEDAARRAAVFAVVPLGLCFLPAFVLLGVVPLVAALISPVL